MTRHLKNKIAKPWRLALDKVDKHESDDRSAVVNKTPLPSGVNATLPENNAVAHPDVVLLIDDAEEYKY